MTDEEQRQWFVWFLALDEKVQMRFIGLLLDHSDADVLNKLKKWIDTDRS